jgi:hypothetical protein
MHVGRTELSYESIDHPASRRDLHNLPDNRSFVCGPDLFGPTQEANRMEISYQEHWFRRIQSMFYGTSWNRPQKTLWQLAISTFLTWFS